MGAFRVAFIGGGSMGQAMAAAIIKNRLADSHEVCISDVNSERLEQLKGELGVRVTSNNIEAVIEADVVVLAVKPQALIDVMTEMKGKLPKMSLLFSIVAGKKIETLVAGFDHQFVVRAMPNTPGQMGKGVTVWVATQDIMVSQRINAEAIVHVLGKGLYTGYEYYLDLATAVSGSGPAYVFLFMEEMIKAAVSLGMDEEMAKVLVFQTVTGSSEYANLAGKELGELRRMVTSPGGTTAAALAKFEEGSFSELIHRAIEAAYQRAVEIGAQ